MSKNYQKPHIILSGDRPTGPLHLGHYAGSLIERVRLQNEGNRCFVMVADLQAYTDNAYNAGKISQAIPEVVADYIGVGIDPTKSTIFLQSAVPELAELTLLYMNMITVSRLERNPTIREEIRLRGFERDLPTGFLCYPVSQAADITGFQATHIPVGSDQLPMIELAGEIAQRINKLAGKEILPKPMALLSKVRKLPGTDGKGKASKSLGNAIHLSDDSKTLSNKVMSMYTDPNHIKISFPGVIRGNVVFSYLDAFDPNVDEVFELKEHYSKGGLGDVALKKRLINLLEDNLTPIRQRRAEAFEDKEHIFKVLKDGSEVAREIVSSTLREVKEALGVFSF